MKTKNYLIVGCGSHCNSVISVIKTIKGAKIVGIIDTNKKIKANEHKQNVPVVGTFNDLIENFNLYNNFSIVLAIGDNGKRKYYFKQLSDLGYSIPNIISSTAYVDDSVKLGNGNFIGHKSLVNANSYIGNNNIINSSAIIEHDVTIKNNSHCAPGSVICGCVSIGNDSFIGAGSVVIPSITISDNIIIGANSTVIKNIIGENKRFVGTPTREII